MSERRACRRHAPRLTLAWAEEPGRARHFVWPKEGLLGGIFSGPEPDQPRETREPFDPSAFISEFVEALPKAPKAAGLSREERELIALMVERSKKAAAMQDNIIVALERLYGKPFADRFAENTFRTEQFQLRLLGEEEAAVGYRKALRGEYETALGRTPERVAAEQAAREIDTQERMYARFQRAESGRSDFDPTLLAGIKSAYENLDASMRQRLGPGWEGSSAGIEARTRLDESVMRTLYTARQEEMARAGGAALSPGVATPRLLVAQGTVPASAAGVGGVSPVSTQAGVLGFATQPVPGALPIFQGLAQERGLRNAQALEAWRTQYGGGLQAGLAGYGSQQNLLRDYYNNLARANLARYQESMELVGTFAGGGMGAAAI